MKLNLLHILCAILRCWDGLDLDNIFFESDALFSIRLCCYLNSTVKRYANFLVFDENLQNLHVG